MCWSCTACCGHSTTVKVRPRETAMQWTNIIRPTHAILINSEFRSNELRMLNSSGNADGHACREGVVLNHIIPSTAMRCMGEGRCHSVVHACGAADWCMSVHAWWVSQTHVKGPVLHKRPRVPLRRHSVRVEHQSVHRRHGTSG
jgi:hypothetical protein